MYNLGIINGDIYTDSQFHKLNIYIEDGKIAEITNEDLKAEKTIDAKGKKVIPGIIDPHVHLELGAGKFTSVDDFYSGTAAGAFGGVTTIIDFLDPVSRAVDVETAFKKRLKLAEKSTIDFTFHTTVANPFGETEKITDEAIRLKIPSIKLFTAYSESNRRTYQNEIKELLKNSNQKGTVILIHSEDEEFMDYNPDFGPKELHISRPALSETSMINKLALLNREYGGRIYCVHTTCGESVQNMKSDFPDLLNRSFFMESCQQYFYFDDMVFQNDDGYKYILAPPLRNHSQSELLKNSIDEVYSIGTDHCPFMLKDKNKSYLNETPFGVGGIEFSFRNMYTLFGDKIIDKMTVNPAKLFGLYPRKGILAPGSDADLFIYNDNKEVKIVENHSRCDYNLYNGNIVNGLVECTISAGQIIMENGKLFPRKGEFIPREPKL